MQKMNSNYAINPLSILKLTAKLSKSWKLLLTMLLAEVWKIEQNWDVFGLSISGLQCFWHISHIFFFMKTTCTPRIKVLNYSFHKIYQNLMFAIPTEKYLIMVHYKAIVHEHEIFIFVCGDFFPADMYLKSISISWDGSSQSSAKSTEQKRQSDIAFLLLFFFQI